MRTRKWNKGLNLSPSATSSTLSQDYTKIQAYPEILYGLIFHRVYIAKFDTLPNLLCTLDIIKHSYYINFLIAKQKCLIPVSIPMVLNIVYSLTRVRWFVNQHCMHSHDTFTNDGGNIWNNGRRVKILWQHFIKLKVLYLSNSTLIGLIFSLCYGNIPHDYQPWYFDLVTIDTLETVSVYL